MQLHLPQKKKTNLLEIYKKKLPTILTNNQLQNLEEFENSLLFSFCSLFLHLQVVLFYINVQYETYHVGQNPIAASLFLPLTSRGAERAFSNWDQVYQKNNATSSAYMERRLFLSTFLYSEVLVALNTCKFSQSIAIFVENLHTCPKRKKTDVIVWDKQTQLAILHNNKVYQRNALQQLNFPSKPLKTNFFNFLSQHSIELTPHQKKNILTNPLRSITLLFAHKMNLIYLFPKQLQYLHRHLPEQQHPLYCIVSASTNDLNDENFRKLITNSSRNQMSTLVGEGDSIIEGVGDGMEVDVGIEGEGKGQKKRKSNKTRKNNSKEYGVKEVLVWEGKKKKYGFI